MNAGEGLPDESTTNSGAPNNTNSISGSSVPAEEKRVEQLLRGSDYSK